MLETTEYLPFVKHLLAGRPWMASDLKLSPLVDDILILQKRKLSVLVPGHLKASARLVAFHFGKQSGDFSKA